MSDHSKQCLEFVDGIQHPNEKVLAQEILAGKKVGEFSLGFDQSQVDAMTDRLKGAGCFAPAEDVQAAPAEEVTPEAATDAPEGGEAPTTPEAPAQTGEATADAPAEAGQETPATPEGEATAPEAPAEGGEETPKTDVPA